MCQRVFSSGAVALVVASVLAVSLAPSLHADDDVKRSFKQAGEAFKKLGKKVGEESKEVGHEIAEAAKKVWYKGKKVSAPLLDDVQRSTREFWEKVVSGQDKVIEQLRDENSRLKRQLTEDE
jgi:gas vesicle protein